MRSLSGRCAASVSTSTASRRARGYSAGRVDADLLMTTQGKRAVDGECEPPGRRHAVRPSRARRFGQRSPASPTPPISSIAEDAHSEREHEAQDRRPPDGERDARRHVAEQDPRRRRLDRRRIGDDAAARRRHHLQDQRLDHGPGHRRAGQHRGESARGRRRQARRASCRVTGYVKNLLADDATRRCSGSSCTRRTFHAFNKRTLADLYVSTRSTPSRAGIQDTLRLTGTSLAPVLTGSISSIAARSSSPIATSRASRRSRSSPTA